ncbi:glutamate decarboxylase [Streptomyces chromofuscus]|uniref:Glutamate decarboxylase n=1 Tax=Streptomyces chromofuscus TaxID=42881 RepID=A0A7M2T958_STRCW|nr:glutamate decarboxylase [Streptomyces chromofuscus]QOV44228.1 glutamate decarboxylase [Streptomyces chromofuscus]GGT31630.1 glutamate decarboxylase [Streptomyces chromofuscus]
MALHQTSRPAPDPADDVYTLPISEQELPKHRMPDGVSDARAVRALIHDELSLDGDASQNLATFCTTWAEPEVHQLMDECLGKNMVDKDEYPQTAAIESRCVHMLADLWNSPDGATTLGCSTTGSSEAGMLGGLALKWRWRERRRAAGRPADRPNLVVGPVQVCWKKFARYFDVELRQVPLEKDALGLRAHQLRDHVDENTIGVVAILGVTYTCVYEPVAEIAAELDRIQQDTGLDIPLHVDAASGGFVAPFLQPDLVWDFRLPRVASINVSGHKYGMAPLGVGWVVWRSPDLLPEDLVFRVSYLGGDMPTFALNFSRPGGEVVAQYYNLLRLGREGYAKVHGACARTARMLAERVAAMGPFTVLYDGQDALPAVTWTLTGPDASPFTLYDITDQLRRRGWQVPAYPLAPGRQDTVVQRVLVRHGTSYDKIALLADDLRAAVGHLSEGPTSHVARRPAFHH